MSSRLSSMLVRDGIVGVKRLEKAFRRQVVYGGNLDTVLLEMGLITEERLCQYLALSTGLPPASRRDLAIEQLDELRAMLPELSAGRHRVVPLALEDEALRLAVHAPFELRTLEDLADQLDRPVQPLIVPEFRWHVWFGRVYGGTPLERFTALALELDAVAQLHPVGKAQTVIVADVEPAIEPSASASLPQLNAAIEVLEQQAAQVAAQDAAVRLAPVGPHQATQRISTPQIAVEELQRRRATLLGLAPRGQSESGPLATPATAPALAAAVTRDLRKRATSRPPFRPTSEIPIAYRETPDASALAQHATASSTRDEGAALGAPVISAAPTVASVASAAAFTVAGLRSSGQSLPTTPAMEAVGTRLVAAMPVTDDEPPADPAPSTNSAASAIPQRRALTASSATHAPQHTRTSPLAPMLARQLLQSATDRDVVFATLVRAMRYRTRWAGVATISGGAVLGRFAFAEEDLDTEAFATALFPLDVNSPLRTAVTTKRPYVGVLRSVPELDVMLRRLGGRLPSDGAIMPILVRNRVVALIIGHRGERPLELADVAEIFALDKFATEALTRFILRNKAGDSSTSLPVQAPDPAPASVMDIPARVPANRAAAHAAVTHAALLPPPEMPETNERGPTRPAEILSAAALAALQQPVLHAPHMPIIATTTPGFAPAATREDPATSPPTVSHPAQAVPPALATAATSTTTSASAAPTAATRASAAPTAATTPEAPNRIGGPVHADPTRRQRASLSPSTATITMPSEAALAAMPISALLDLVERATPAQAATAIGVALDRSAEALPELAQRFPGVLRVDRFTVPGRPLPAAQYGGLLELLVTMGDYATPLIVEKMQSPQRDDRFYAAVCAVELRPPTALGHLVERLFDADFGVRLCAMAALQGYPLRDLTNALQTVRAALASDELERVAAATHAVADLSDAAALPELLNTLARGGRFADHARMALMSLTRQDFGTSERKWRRWAQENRSTHRIEWLIDALSQREDALRKAAIDDLRRLTNEFFGYHHDLPKKDRDAAIARWRAWWRETGAKRFGVTQE